jgi:hypothetical protein
MKLKKIHLSQLASRVAPEPPGDRQTLPLLARTNMEQILPFVKSGEPLRQASQLTGV